MRTSPYVLGLFLATAQSRLTAEEVAQISEGVLVGALQTEDLNDYVSCVKESETVVADIEDAVHSFEKKNISGVSKGLEDIADALTVVSTAMQTCTQQKDIDQLKKLESMLEQFKSPKSFAMHIGKDILINGKNIFAEIENAISNYKAAKYEAFGEDIGDALALTLIGKTEIMAKQALASKASAAQVNEGGLKEVAQITEGILIGALNAEGLENIESCLKDSEHIFEDIKIAVGDFEERSASGTTKGLKELGEAVITMSHMMKDCHGVVADIEKLTKMAAIFSSPASFAFHTGKDIIVNGVQIYDDIEGALKQYKSQSYEAFGEEVGDALALLILGAPEEDFERATDESLEALAIDPVPQQSW